ncbi:hypothetical protein AB0I72_19645 [Nocardiopsis sp. NPDC049922]|uniref:hypothetical protein n=1 Tax=Nocardiopsis sp. NPDC049922 TaxID=3155157 RepID=UPI0033F42587
MHDDPAPDAPKPFIYRPDPTGPLVSMIIDDGHRPPPEGYWLYTTPTGYLFRLWEGSTFLRVIRGYRRSLTGEPEELILRIWGFESWDDVPEDGTGYWGHGEAPVDYRGIRCLEAAGLLVPYH